MDFDTVCRIVGQHFLKTVNEKEHIIKQGQDLLAAKDAQIETLQMELKKANKEREDALSMLIGRSRESD